MKKILIASVLFTVLYSCSGNTADNITSGNTADSAGLTNPITIDTTKHPTGVDNSSVISTDTAAMNVQNSYQKLDSVQKQK